MYLVSYPASFLPATLAEGFIQRVHFRLKHDRLRLSNKTLRAMAKMLSADEKKRVIQMLKEDKLLQFAYHALRIKTKQPKTAWNERAFIEQLVDKVAGIPYGARSFLDMRFFRDKDENLMLGMRVWRGDPDGKAYPTHFGMAVPAHIAVDIRNALDRLISRHKGKLALARKIATEKDAANSNRDRLRNIRAQEDQHKGAEQNES